MRNFFLGLVIGLAVGIGLYLRLSPRDPCQVCGAGTHCQEGRCLAAAPAPPPVVPPKRRVRRAQGSQTAQNVQAQSPDEPPAPPAIVLKPGDLKSVSAGDRLTGTEVVDLSKDSTSEHELTQDEIDGVFHGSQNEVLGCLDQARGEAQVRGRLTVSFRIQRSGAMSGVRVEAPSYLMQHGLLGCIKPIVSRMRFPASRSAQVVSYPFSLN